MSKKYLTGLGSAMAGLSEMYNTKNIEILNAINSKKSIGTLKLSKEVKLAPKNLINRIKTLEKLGLITKENIPAKPKGRIRLHKLTKDGANHLKIVSDLIESKKLKNR